MVPTANGSALACTCREAIHYLKTHAGEFCRDPERITILGGFVGGNLAAMVGMNVPNGAFLREEGKVFSCQPAVQAAIDQFGPVRFETTEAQARANGVSEIHPNAEVMPESKYLGVAVDRAPPKADGGGLPGN